MSRTPAGTPPNPKGAERFNEEQATYAVRGSDKPDIEEGVRVIRETVRTLKPKPGVYRMHDVRGDVLYRLFPVRWQARVDFVLYILFFFPGILALFWYGWEIAADSWRYKEVSWNSPARIQIYFFKTLIPVAGALLMIQGLAELMRCWIAMRDGAWPARIDDVRETEDMLVDMDPAAVPRPADPAR